MIINVRIPTASQAYELGDFCPESTTFGDLQRVIHEKSTVPAEYQRIIFGGKELKDPAQKVSDMGLSKQNNTLFLIMRLNGGQSAS